MVWPKRKSLKTYFRGRVNQVRVIYRKITKKSDKGHAKKFIESVSLGHACSYMHFEIQRPRDFKYSETFKPFFRFEDFYAYH